MNMDHLYIKTSRINGKGLHSNKKISKGEKVGLIHGKIEIIKEWTPKLSSISPNWIGIGRYSWINTINSPFRYINHSCDPNTIITGKRTVIAIKPINKDDEVTMDYSLTESDSGWFIEKCGCGRKTCRKFIGPITSLDFKIFQKKQELIPENFKRIYLTNYRKLTSSRK